MHERVII